MMKDAIAKKLPAVYCECGGTIGLQILVAADWELCEKLRTESGYRVACSECKHFIDVKILTCGHPLCSTCIRMYGTGC